MKLLLDEMISPRIARELRARGHDVVAIEDDRPETMGFSDRGVVRKMAIEQRVIVANNVRDFRLIHDGFLGSGDDHYGMVFTFDDTMPRTKSAIPQWVSILEALLVTCPDDDALRNRVRILP